MIQSLESKIGKNGSPRKSGLVAQASIDLTRTNTNYRIKTMRRVCYLPNGILLLFHWVFNGFFFGKLFEISRFLEPIYLGLAGAIFILLANITKGAQIFDPNRRF